MGHLSKILESSIAKINSNRILLSVLLIIGFILRSFGNDSGLPFYFLNWDMEYTVVNIAIRMATTGDLNPHFFCLSFLGYVYLRYLF